MDIVTMKSKLSPTKSKDNRPLNDSLLNFDIPILIDMMKNKPSWTKEGLTSMILLKSSTRQIVLTALDRGTEIHSFQSNDSVTFQIIKGDLILKTRKETLNVRKDQMISIQEKIKYSLSSKEETVFLLTIAK
jgi:quercetin dioxygenase-like cupin family protein